MRALTTSEAAERLGVTVRRVNDLITSGRLPAERFGQAYMIREGDLKLVENRKPGRPRKAQTEKPSKEAGKKGSRISKRV
jgi:excisionase family DNA binding protein